MSGWSERIVRFFDGERSLKNLFSLGVTPHRPVEVSEVVERLVDITAKRPLRHRAGRWRAIARRAWQLRRIGLVPSVQWRDRRSRLQSRVIRADYSLIYREPFTHELLGFGKAVLRGIQMPEAANTLGGVCRHEAGPFGAHLDRPLVSDFRLVVAAQLFAGDRNHAGPIADMRQASCVFGKDQRLFRQAVRFGISP